LEGFWVGTQVGDDDALAIQKEKGRFNLREKSR
jgi:hypothetical protein